VVHRSLALRADGTLGDDEGKSGSRTLMALGAGLNRVQTSDTDPSSSLVWDSEPLAQDLDVVGGIEVQLDAASTATDTARMAFLQDVDAAGISPTSRRATSGQARVKSTKAASRPGAPRPRLPLIASIGIL